MDNFFDLILHALFTSLFTSIFLYLVLTYQGLKLIAKIQESLEDEEEANGVDLIDAYIEKTDSSLLLYRKDDNSFIAQGSNWTELNVNAVRLHPDVRFNVTPEDIKMAQEFKL